SFGGSVCCSSCICGCRAPGFSSAATTGGSWWCRSRSCGRARPCSWPRTLLGNELRWRVELAEVARSGGEEWLQVRWRVGGGRDRRFSDAEAVGRQVDLEHGSLAVRHMTALVKTLGVGEEDGPS